METFLVKQTRTWSTWDKKTLPYSLTQLLYKQLTDISKKHKQTSYFAVSKQTKG